MLGRDETYHGMRFLQLARLDLEIFAAQHLQQSETPGQHHQELRPQLSRLGDVVQTNHLLIVQLEEDLNDEH
jgi:hypothetical protein